MELKIYKGFDLNFLEQLDDTPLITNSLESKKNVLLFDKKIKKQLDIALLGLDDDESAWITYEEYTLIKTRIEDAIRDYDLKVTIYKNNLYPDYYPIPFDLNSTLIQEINTAINTDNTNGSSEECKRFLTVYNTIILE